MNECMPFCMNAVNCQVNLPSTSERAPRICSFTNLFVRGAFKACLIPTDVLSK